jgi:SAM-dependent methyltransferase
VGDPVAMSARTEARRRAHNQAQRRYFESQPKPNMVPRSSPYLERHVEELAAAARLRPGERVLEVGCGMGRYTLPLAARGLRMTGIDISPALLERLRSVADARYWIELVEGDVVNPPEGLARDFDAVIGLFVLHHLHDLSACLDSIRGLVRPGGRVAFLEPNAYNPLYYVQMMATPTMSWVGDRGVIGMRRRALVRAMRTAGLVDVRLQRFGFFPPFVTQRPRGAEVERRLERLPGIEPFLPFQLISASRGDG